MSVVLIQCTSLPSANSHLPNPWKLGEKAIFLSEVENKGEHPETFYKQFIVIKRLPSKIVEVESRKHFKFLNKPSK